MTAQKEHVTFLGTPIIDQICMNVHFEFAIEKQSEFMKRMVEFPPTIRFPRMDEVPMDAYSKERIRKLESANIVAGYRILGNNENEAQMEMPFKFYAEININNSMLWDLIIDLAGEIPDVASLIFGHGGDELFYGEYMPKKELLEQIGKYEVELSKDAFIEWGIIYNDKNRLVEIYIPESKYIKYWGVDKEAFQEKMARFKLNEVENLEFIDQYPKVCEPLTSHEKNVIHSEELIDIFIRKYTKNNLGDHNDQRT